MKNWLLGLGALACASGMPMAASAQHGERDALAAAIEADSEASLERLREWIALPTIANMGINHLEGAEHMAAMALDAGFDSARIVETGGVPGVFAKLDAGAEHTFAVYFMYDVKHYDESEWEAPPLEGRIVEKDDHRRIVGRGATNQKGPENAFLSAVRAFKTAGVALPVNLVLIAEGEEEIGSPNFAQMLEDEEILSSLQSAVGIIIPMGNQNLEGQATLLLGAKGVIEVQLIADGTKSGDWPAADIHSSLGAVVENPAWRLVKALDTLVEDDGYTPAIPGWFENVQPLTERQKEIILAGLPESDEPIKKMFGIERWIEDEDMATSAMRLASQPTVTIQGLVSGYMGPGGKTVLPGRAEAKLDFRLVPDMTFDEAVTKLKAHLVAEGFDDIEVVVSGGYGPTQTAEESVLVKAAQMAWDRLGIEHALSPRIAGSWPGVLFTAPPLSLPAIPFGTGRGGGAHAPNEWVLYDSEKPFDTPYAKQPLAFVELFYALSEVAGE